jgi:tetratricopeptide (TPR) repeat protein
MLNSRTIHFIVLGVIMGSAVAYAYGSYQTSQRRQAETAAVAASTGAGGEAAAHPDVTEQEMLDLFTQALAVSPNDPELLSRYATYLFSIQRYAESVEWFRRLIALTPGDATMRTALATALYGNGRVGEAIQEYQRALEIDPDHTLALHNLVLAYLEQPRNVDGAREALRRLESVDPAYDALPTLRSRLAAAGGGA